MTDPLESCTLCPHQCRANRKTSRPGRCGAGANPVIYRYAPHYGEEPPISGTKGSGTIFFSHCTLSCIHCQNFPWSQNHSGTEYNVTELAEILRDLASSGCHNWNLVSPTPWLPTIAQAVSHVKQAGIRMPIVYNTSGFEKRETLAAYSSLLDVALVDVRYAYPATAKEACGTAAYVNAARATLKYCWQTLGPLQSDADGIAQKGVICRILVLPGHADEACANLEWIAENIGTELTLSVMSQYTPAHKATEMPPWDRRVTVDEYRTVTEKLESLGFENGWTQDLQEAPPEGLLGYSMQPE